MEKELQGFKEGLEADIHVDSLRATLKKVRKWKMLGQDMAYIDFCLKKTHIHP